MESLVDLILAWYSETSVEAISVWGYGLWKGICFILLGWLILLGYLHNTAPVKTAAPRLSRPSMLYSERLFQLSVIFTVWLLRLPSLTRIECNVDESSWISFTITLLRDPRYWLSVDGGATGPFVPSLPMIFHFLNVPITYHSVRILTIFIWIVGILLLYKAISHLINDTSLSKLFILPLVACVAMASFNDYIAYNSEMVLALFLAVCLYLFARILEDGHDRYYIMLGFVLGMLPFSKFQSIPLTIFFIAAILFYAGVNRQFLSVIKFITSGLVPPCILFIYLYATDILNDFWYSFIKMNMQYAQFGLWGFAYNHWQKATIFVTLLLEHVDTRIYVLFCMATTVVFSGILAGIFTKLSLKDKYISVFSIGLFATTFYCIYKPPFYLYHYLVLALGPFIFTCGILVFMVYKYQKIKVAYINALYLGAIFLMMGSILLTDIPYHPFKKLPETMGEIKRDRRVAEALLKNMNKEDTLAIWGWGCRIHVQTQIALGARDSSSPYLILPHWYRDFYIQRFVGDLERNKPKIFMDVAVPGNFMFNNPETQGHQNFEPVAEYIQQHYRYVASVDSMKIYTRIEGD